MSINQKFHSKNMNKIYKYTLSIITLLYDSILISDKPICRPDQKRVYGVAKNEPANVDCNVDSYPPPDSFKWSFNNTTEVFDMPQSGHTVNHTAQTSTLTYTPVKVSQCVTSDTFNLYFPYDSIYITYIENRRKKV